MPHVLLVVPLFAILFLPVYGPFLLSFTISSPRWRGMRWSLRVASLVAFIVGLAGGSSRLDHVDDVAGNMAGGSDTFFWIWASGSLCAIVAVLVGSFLRAYLEPEPCAPSDDGRTPPVGNSGASEEPPSGS